MRKKRIEQRKRVINIYAERERERAREREREREIDKVRE